MIVMMWYWNNNPQEKKLWELLIEKGLISQDELCKALHHQVQYAAQWIQHRIWEILVAGQALENRRVLISALVKNGIKLRIWESLLLLWHINEQQYRHIRNTLVELQKNKTQKTFWEVAIELWYIKQEAFYEYLEEVWIKLKVWEKLVKEKIISPQLLNLVLEEQRNNPAYKEKKFLDILLYMRAITQEQYDKFSWRLWESDSIEFSLE